MLRAILARYETLALGMPSIQRAKKATAERPSWAPTNSAYIVLYNPWAKGARSLSSYYRNMHSIVNGKRGTRHALTSKMLEDEKQQNHNYLEGLE